MGRENNSETVCAEGLYQISGAGKNVIWISKL